MAKRKTFKNGEKILNGRYEVLKLIHSSGMSNVYLVIDNNLNKQWCLKEIRKSDAGRDNIEYYSLLQEANIMKGLSNPYIPRIVTIEEDGDSLFIVMDYVDGISLRSYVDKYGVLNPELMVRVMLQVVGVIMYLHNMKKPIIYRDMKPENVMLQNDGSIRLVDFGISVVIDKEGKLIDKPLGTKGYAAPEQGKVGTPYDLRSDIYALGKTMYFLLTGINPTDVLNKIRPIEEVLPELSSGLVKVINKCIKKNPNDRYQDCEELIYDLSNYKVYEKDYNVKLRKKVKIWAAVGILSTLCLGGSFIPLHMDKVNKNTEYESLVSIAKQSGKAEDYEDVFNNTPNSDISLYLDYIETLKQDGIFTKEEEKSLVGYINSVISDLKSSSNYGELAFNIGKLYWFYYEGSTDTEGMINSISWFSDALDNGYESDLSKVYYELGVFNRDILSSITESEDVGMYSKYWENLLEVQKYNSGDLLTLQVDLSVISCINSYSYGLKRDGVDYNSIKGQIDSINSFIQNYTPNSDASIEKYDKLVSSIKNVEPKLNAVYTDN